MITATSRHNERHEFESPCFRQANPVSRPSLSLSLSPRSRHLCPRWRLFYAGSTGGRIRVIDKGASLSGEDLLIIVCASFKNNRRLRVTSRCRVFPRHFIIHSWSVRARGDRLLTVHHPRWWRCCWGISFVEESLLIAALDKQHAREIHAKWNVNCPRNFDR